MLAGLGLTGCGAGGLDAAFDAGFKRIFTGRKSPQQYMLVAVSSKDPDARRDALVRVSKSKQYKSEWAIKGFVAIALLESEPQTRCVAIRALARTGDRRATETALKILNYRDYPPREIWPPVPLVRWDATEALADLSAAGQVPDDLLSKVHKTLLTRLREDSNRHARIAAARGLPHYPQMTTVEALIDGLRDEDFAVVHQCEEALVRLTGRTHDANAYAWRQWLDEHRQDVFAHAGEIPQSRRLPYNNRWQKTTYETKEFIRWLWPGAKEE